MANPNAQMFHTPMVDPTLPQNFSGLFVPQAVWVAAAGPREFNRLPNIRFAQNGRTGIRLADALQRNFNGMTDANTVPCTTTTSQRVAIRINWPGYESWYKHVNIANNTDHINKARLAYEVAKEVQRFYTEMAQTHCTERDWSISRVPYAQLVLLELRHVGVGSWQPVLGLAFNG